VLPTYPITVPAEALPLAERPNPLLGGKRTAGLDGSAPGQGPNMATVPAPEEPVGSIRIWASYADPAVARRVADALEEAGVGRDRVTVAADAGVTEGAVARARERRGGMRTFSRMGLGALVGAVMGGLLGAVIGAVTGSDTTAYTMFIVGGVLFGGGVGTFIGGLASLGSAAPDHQPSGDEAPGGVAVEVRDVGGSDRGAIDVLRRFSPTALELTDARGVPIHPDELPETSGGGSA